jgi:hypothetical protein
MPILSFLRRPVVWIVPGLLFAAWLAFGFLAVPRLVAGYLRDTVATDYGRTLGVGPVSFNPLSLTLELQGLSLPDADGGPLMAFDRLRVDLEVASLWRGGWTFRAIALDGLAVDATVRPGGALNLADLAEPRVPPGTPPPSDEPLPRLFIGELRVSDGRMRFTDRDRPQPFAAEVKPVTFVLRDFSTAPDASGERYELDAAVFGDARLRWQGSLRAEPLASAGELTITALPLPALDEFLGEALPARISGGRLGIRGRYDLRGAADGLQFTLADGAVSVADLRLRARAGTADLVAVPALSVTGIRADTTRREVIAGSVTAADGVVSAVLAADGRLNLAALAGEPDPAATVTPVGKAAPGADEPGWTLGAPRIALSGFRVTLEDQSFTPAARLEVAPLAIDVTGFSTAPGTTLRTEVAATLNGAATLRVSADTTLDDLATRGEVALADLPLADFQAYVDEAASLAIRRGTLGATGSFTVEPGADPLRASFTGDVTVAGFRGVDTLLNEDFLRWDSLRLGGVRYVAEPAALSVREVTAVSPYARVIIGPDGVTNLTTVLTPPGTAPPAVTDAANPPAGAAQLPAAPTAAAPLPVRIDVVRITDGSTNFADFSITPRFATGIQKLAGTVRGLSSDPASRATIALDGQVDRFSPVTIRGEVNPLAAETYLDLAMSFRNFELASFTPYSGRFAGYAIRQGKLAVDLRYRVADRQLKADHKIVIDQLELGDKVESPDAVSLPLKLAVALLKDRNGVIDLELPVSGSLDDPQFRIGPIVWKVLVNVLTKAVTAPFALLGSLFGGGEDINRVAFAAGGASLEGEGLATLVKALAERPGLELTVPAVYSTETDGPVLAEQRFRRRVVAAKRREVTARKGDPDAVTWDSVTADREDYQRQLRAVWQREAPGEPVPAPPAEPPPDAATGAETRIAALEAVLRARIRVGDTELFELGRARAEAVQARLLEGTGIAPERVFLVAPTAVTATDGQVVMELALR